MKNNVVLIGQLTTSEIDRQRLFYIKRAQENCVLSLNLQPSWQKGAVRMLRTYAKRVENHVNIHCMTELAVRTRYWIPRLLGRSKRKIGNVVMDARDWQTATVYECATRPPGIVPKRDETTTEFQCTEDSPEEISLIINNKPNYEADEYSLNANYDKC
jgi:hypothetical protein